MKTFKTLALAIMLIATGLFFTACEETTTPTDAPVISSITPGNGVTGDNITIKGTGFGSASSAGTVYVGSVPVAGTVGASGSDYVSWTDTEIIFKVPANAVMGSTTLYVHNGSSSSNVVDFLVGGPSTSVNKPGDIWATALANTSDTTGSIRVLWTMSKDESLVNFYGYRVEIKEDNTTTTTVKMVQGKTTKTCDFTGLRVGKVYTVKVSTLLNNGLYSANASTVSWSPSLRFKGIKVYESASALPSGIDLYDAATKAPLALTVANGSAWDLGLDTKNSDYAVGSPSELTYKKVTNPRPTKIYSLTRWDDINSLDEIYDTDLLGADAVGYLSFADTDKSWTIGVKTADGNFAKILIKNIGGKILQGTAPDRYIEVDISYQPIANVPYAK